MVRKKKESEETLKENIDNSQDDVISAETRKIVIDEFNKSMSDYAVLRDGPVSQEFKDQCKKDFEDEMNKVKNMTFEIANKERALDVAHFLQEYNKTIIHWEKMAWKGVIYFDQIIGNKIAELEKELAPLVFDYGALTFLYGSMMNPSGYGLESARVMEVLETIPEGQEDDPENAVTYSAILEKIGKHIDFLKAEDKKINVLQQRWAIAESGIYMDIRVKELEDYVNFYEQLKSVQHLDQ